MNYCHLADELDMSPEEVRSLLSSAQDYFYNLIAREWFGTKSVGSIRVRSEHHIDFSVFDPTRFDDYTNQITQLGWLDLCNYLASDIKVQNIIHAAFLLDIADKNCIPVPQLLVDKCRVYRAPEVLIPFQSTTRRDYDAIEWFINRSVVVHEVLNLIVDPKMFIKI